MTFPSRGAVYEPLYQRQISTSVVGQLPKVVQRLRVSVPSISHRRRAQRKLPAAMPHGAFSCLLRRFIEQCGDEDSHFQYCPITS